MSCIHTSTILLHFIGGKWRRSCGSRCPATIHGCHGVRSRPRGIPRPVSHGGAIENPHLPIRARDRAGVAFETGAQLRFRTGGGNHDAAIKCKNVWVWKIARLVMLVWHDQKVCDAFPRRDPFACHAKTQFVMRKTQHKEGQIFLMLACALQSMHYSQRSITSFQTQTFLQLIAARIGSVFE